MTFSPVSPYKVFGLSRPRGPSPDLLDYTLFLPSIWLVCGLAIALRLVGPLFVVIPVGFCLLYAVLRLTVPPRLLSAYVAFCIFVATSPNTNSSRPRGRLISGKTPSSGS
jgi:hypothetical protein